MIRGYIIRRDINIMRDQVDPKPSHFIKTRENNIVNAEKFGGGSNSYQIVNIPEFMSAQAKATEEKIGSFNFDSADV